MNNVHKTWTALISHCQLYYRSSSGCYLTILDSNGVHAIEYDTAERIRQEEIRKNAGLQYDNFQVSIVDGKWAEYVPKFHRSTYPPMTEENIRLNAEYKSIINKLARKMWRECHVKNQYGRWECLDGVEHDWTGEADEVIRDRNYYSAIDSYVTDMIERHEEEEEVRKHEVLEKFGIDLDEVDPNF